MMGDFWVLDECEEFGKEHCDAFAKCCRLTDFGVFVQIRLGEFVNPFLQIAALSLALEEARSKERFR